MLNQIENTNSLEKLSIKRLVLNNYRNYENLAINLEPKPIVITGANGIGKTNILEAISLMSPGKGLRGAKLNEIDNNTKNNNPWSVSAIVNTKWGEIQFGTGREQNLDSNKRIIKIDGKKIRNQAEITSLFSVIWITPQMDGIFIDSGSNRRKFIDRLVYNFDSEHSSRIYSYDYSLRERMKLLLENGESSWIKVVEQKIAEKAIAIAIARKETVNIINQSIIQAPTSFPKGTLTITGYVEDLIEQHNAQDAEIILKDKISNSRVFDIATKRSNIGIHKSDFTAFHIEKNMQASLCSTGEQKALLLSIILAEARAKIIWKNSVPILLFDEVIAHLDEHSKIELFDELLDMSAQVWLTGTEKSSFDYLKNNAQFIHRY